MKSLKLALISVTFSILLPLSPAHADFSSYAEVYAVGSQGSTAFQPEFTINEQPYLYVQFYNAPPAGALDNVLTFSSWTSPDGTSYTPTATPITSTNQLWISFAPSQWNSIKTTGTWDTGTFSFSTTGTPTPFGGAASFKVTAAPEPMSMVLFLVGALFMVIYIQRRKQAIAF